MRLSFLLLLAGLYLWAAPPALSARISYCQRLETPDGMTKITVFEEQLIRTANRVWLERVLPEANPLASDPGESHLHPADLGVAARYLVRNPSGSVDLLFVHPSRVKIHAEPRDYPEVGFDGSWATAYHLLDPARLKELKPLARKAATGARWYGSEDSKQFMRVLWSHRWDLPLRIETGSRDGRRLNITAVRPGPLPKSLPWEGLAGMADKEYTDLLD